MFLPGLVIHQHQQQQQQHTMQHTMHTHRRTATGTSTEMYTTYASAGCNVGVGVGVAMGVMVGVANVAVRESVVATKRKQRSMVKMHALLAPVLLIPPTGRRAIMWSRTLLKA